jgi:LacI family transcriptional regulator
MAKKGGSLGRTGETRRALAVAPAERVARKGTLSDEAAQPRKRSATIVDVANSANVAIGTVSRHLNGLPVRRGNRNQIEQAIADLGYRRNAVAAAMKTDKTHMIGLLVPGFDEFHAQVLQRLAQSIRRTERALVTYCHSNDPKIFREALDFFAGQRVDALIIDGTYIAGNELHDVGRTVPVVFYNDVIAGVSADRVVVENLKASCRAVNHLIDLGHEKIAILCGNQRDSSARQRLQGFEKAMHDRGLKIDPDYIGTGDWGADSAYAKMKTLMSLPTPPTALFASNYQIAVGALTWLKEQGLKVPDDLSLVSFDDVAAFRLHEAGITAIAQPIARIAESITDLLLLRLNSPHDGVTHTATLDCDIILRGSARRLDPPQAGRRPSRRN